MAPQLQRSVTAQQEVLNTAGGARLSSWALPAKNNSVLEIQKYYNPAQWKRVPPNKQILVPPPHWHWHQTEYFDIKKGYVRTPPLLPRILAREVGNNAVFKRVPVLDGEILIAHQALYLFPRSQRNRL
jgi:hypothetical protein